MYTEHRSMAHEVVPLLLLFTIHLTLAATAAAAARKQAPTVEDEEIERLLKRLNKPPLKSYHTKYGDTFDCINIYKQPAFDHPLLWNHTIQMRPNSSPKASKDKISPISLNASRQIGIIGEGCPKGTVPIRRVMKQDLLRANSLSRFGRIKIGKKDSTLQIGSTRPYPAGLYSKLGKYYGAKAIFNNWSPKVPDAADYSDAEISLDSVDYNMQAGWMVNPKVFNDSRPRLFTYWTVDSFQNTGCLNHLCPGFVQTGRRYPLGSPIERISTYGDKNNQWEREFHVYRDPQTHNWWLSIGRNGMYKIGYWPRELVTKLADEGADSIYWGGEASTPDLVDGLEMGSGHYPYEGFGKAAFIRKIQYVLDDGEGAAFVDADTVFASAGGYPDCYDVSRKLFTGDWGRNIYYGGGPPNFACKD